MDSKGDLYAWGMLFGLAYSIQPFLADILVRHVRRDSVRPSK